MDMTSQNLSENISANGAMRRQTHALIDFLPDAYIRKVYDFTLTLSRETENPFKPLSESEVLEAIDKSIQQSKNGEYRDFREAMNDIGKEFGFVR